MKVVVLGGGLSGLAAAHRLESLLPEAEITLIEQSQRVGGALLTEHADGFVIEGGPDSFLSRKERGVGLCEELGIAGELVGRKPENARSYVRRGSELHPLPEGLTGMIPTDLDSLAASTLLSRRGPGAPGGRGRSSSGATRRRRVDRVLRHPPARTGGLRAARRAAHDGHLRRRRRATLAAGHLPEPACPRARARERDPWPRCAADGERRLLFALRLARVRAADARSSPGGAPPADTRQDLRARRSACGEGLAATRSRSTGRSNSPPTASWSLCPRSSPRSCSQSSLPSWQLPMRRFPTAPRRSSRSRYRTDDVAHPLDGYGYVVPRAEGSDVLACSWTSSKWEGRAPDGLGAPPCVRRSLRRGATSRADSDDELVALARDELRLLDVDSEPCLTRIHRWPRGMPQYVLGHPERLERIDAALADHPGLAARRSGVSRSRHPGLHPLRRGGRALARGVPRPRPRMTREASERLFAEALELMPGGVSSPVRAFRAVGGTPLFIERGEGAYLVDVDGNRYLDYVLSWGPLDPRARASAGGRRARRKRCGAGRATARPSPLELELARLIRESHAEHRARALRELRNRGDDERAQGRTGVHRALEDRQVHGLLPRPRGRPAGSGGLGCRHARTTGLAGGDAGCRRGHAHRAVQRPRRRSSDCSPSTRARSRRSSWSRSPGTWGSSRPRTASSRGCAH